MAPEPERLKPYAAVYLMLFDDGEVLLLKRKNTGHRDGAYSLVAGHIDVAETASEAMVREANEEVGIDVMPRDLDAAHLIHRRSGDRVYLDLFYQTADWHGDVRNREPEKCAELSWMARDDLPENTVPYVEQAIGNVPGDFYSEFGW
ncbi:MAG: NUDIX domain-containing protein [Halobacteriales archaeon]